jgi:hypothetical protein
MGIFTNNMFWGSEKKTEEIATKPAATPVAVAAVATKPTTIAIPGQVDPDISQILEEAIKEADIAGFDYLEFRDILTNMKALNLPEPQMFQAAFASAQIAKITKIQLLEAIDFYLKVLEAKDEEFHSYVAGLEATDVIGKDSEIADIERLIEADAAKIQELTIAIGERRKKQDEIRMGKAQADLDIKNKKSAFESTKAAIVEKIKSDRTKIDTYIQG